jgi:hypothetical protein
VSAQLKGGWRARYEQLLYWTAVGWDIVRPGAPQGIYVLGYIKTGTNWLSHLVSTALGLPINEVWKLNLPMLGPCVHHLHRFVPVDAIRERTIYIMRDGRDTLVSAYFHFVRDGGVVKSELERRLGRPVSSDNIRDNLAEFVRLMQISRTATIDYRSHIDKWRQHKHRYATLRYEDLLGDTAGELTRVLAQVTGRPPDVARVANAVAAHDFARVTGRARGTEDRNTFVRKGTSGDWRNYFTPAAASAFDSYAGDVLLELGYEQDPDWASRVT